MRIVVVSGTSRKTVKRSAKQRLSTARLMLEEMRFLVRLMVTMARPLHTAPKTITIKLRVDVKVTVTKLIWT